MKDFFSICPKFFALTHGELKRQQTEVSQKGQCVRNGVPQAERQRTHDPKIADGAQRNAQQ